MLENVTCHFKIGYVFTGTTFGWIKPEKSENTVKTLRLRFSELKMQAVFTRKNKAISRLYDQKSRKVILRREMV